MKIKITKSNAIINSSYRLSLNELRIVLYGLSQIDPMATEFPLFHRINIKELAEFFDIGEKDRGSFYDNIKDSLIRKFWERDFSYYDETLGEIVKRRWLIEVRYGGKDGSLAYHYNPMIKDQLQQLARRFTSYSLANISKMKSAYSVRLYEIAIMHLNASQQSKITFKKDIKELKNNFGISDKYKYFYHFRSRVLETAKREINKYSDIKIHYEVKKLGRVVNAIEFTVSKKSPENVIPVLPARFEKVTTIAIEKAKQIVMAAGTGWDVYSIEQQFIEFIKKKGAPENLEAAFLGFVRKKVKKRPSNLIF